MLKQISLVDMRKNETGIIVRIQGGRGVYSRLQAQGIRPGIKVARVNAGFGRGPVVLQIGNAQVALGFGVSARVIVEV